jgi:YVTN family beta-propeller protein
LYVAGYTGPVPGGLPGITIIDTASNTIETTIPFGNFPFAVAAHPDSSKVYVTDSDNSTVTVIDTASQNISQTVTVGTSPKGIAVHPDGTRVYVANEESNNIFVIDTFSNNVTETISLPGRPNQVVFNPAGTWAYVTSEEGSNMWVIDTSSRIVIATVDVGPGSCGVDVTPDGAYVYVVTESYDDVKGKPVNYGVKVIDAATNTVKKKIKLPGQPSSMGKFIGGPQFHMTVQTAGSGTGKVISKKLPDIDCGSKCEADFYVNRKVQLQAVPDEGSVLTGWSGACTKKSKTCKLVITDDYSVTATFEPK